ncbi:MAG: extracellular solute-binding protein [Deltaproteobacteria bacterium]|nr:extracellular solute-binding protein [Deltaproteobacteria bacterium]
MKVGRTRVISWLGLGAAMLMTAPAYGQRVGWEQILERLYPAAKKEGEVVFNGGSGEMNVGGKEGLAKFAKRFPGVKLTVSNLASSKVGPRVITEARAGKITLDAYHDDPPPAKEMIDRGLVAQLDPQELTEKPERQTWVFSNKLPAVSHTTTHLAYSTNLVKKADVPKRYEDLLDPKWKGRIAVDGRGPYGFTHLRLVWGEERFWKFIKVFPDQKPIWDTRCSGSTDRVVIGEVYIGCASFPNVQELKAKGAPIEFLPLDPVYARVKLFIAIKGSPHPNATKLLLAWLLSPEGAEAVDKAGSGPAIPGTSYYDELIKSGAKLFYNDKLTYEQMVLLDRTRDEIGKLWGVMK